MKNIEILSIVNAYVSQKAEKTEGLKLPAAIAWKRRINLDRLFKAKGLIDDALKEIEQKYADEEHSAEAEDGKGRTVKPEFLEAYFRERGEIMIQETPVDITKVKIEDIGDMELSDADMDTLAFMIEE